jgi:predicted nucleic acid-binding protein
LQFRFAITDVARREAQAVRRGVGEHADDRDPIPWEELVTAEMVDVLTLTGEAEAATFVEFAAQLDDGEAATCALARHRGYAVATDDRSARRLLPMGAPAMRIYSTLDLMRQWCDVRTFRPAEIGQVLNDVRERGRFLPPRANPLRPWWERFFPEAEQAE